MPVTNVKTKWSSGNLVFYPVSGTSGTVHFGEDGTGMDQKFFGSTASSYALFDASANELLFDGYDIHLNDADELRFGDLAAGDVVCKWTGSAFSTTFAATAGWTIGSTAANVNITQKGTLTVGANTEGYDVKFFGTTTSKYFLWDNSADQLIVSGTVDAGSALEADSYSVGGTAGVDFASGSVSNLHVIKGLVVFAS